MKPSKEMQLSITFTEADIEFLRGLILEGREHEGLLGHIVEEYECLIGEEE